MEIESCVEKFVESIQPKRCFIEVPITKCYGKIAAEDICAGMMVPHFPKSAMDGYAVRAEDLEGVDAEHPVSFRVIGCLYAGDYEEIPYEKNTAVRVMTGSFVPDGYDAVVRQEDTDYGEKIVEIRKSVKSYTAYCKIGEDIQKGTILVRKGTRLTAVHAGLLASVGIASVKVQEPLKVSVISTGSEVTGVGEVLLPGRIYNSTAYTLVQSVEKEGMLVESMRICADQEEILRQAILEANEKSDIVITTGGVSVGAKDLLPAVMDHLGAKKVFTSANIQPGTPTMGCVLNGKPILCLSGNPYAALANFEIYFWELAARLLECEYFHTVVKEAVLMNEYRKPIRRRRFVRARYEDGKVYLPTDNHASSVLHNMVDCNCFLDLKVGKTVNVGDKVSVRMFRGI